MCVRQTIAYVGTLKMWQSPVEVTNLNCIHEQTSSTLNFGYYCYHSVGNLFFFGCYLKLTRTDYLENLGINRCYATGALRIFLRNFVLAHYS